MAKVIKNRMLWEILILWGVWALISISLMHGLDRPGRIIVRLLPTLIGFIVIVYVNVKYLLPQFYLQKEYTLYILYSVLLLMATVFFLNHPIFPWAEWFSTPPPPPIGEDRTLPPRPFDVRWMREITPLLVAFLGSTILEITQFARLKEQENLAAELKFLKSQVNPHFLFNALNNIYSLAVVQAPQTPETVMQLSEILRYMVYDSNEEKVSLASEINYIKNFVELQLLKDSRGMNVALDLDNSVGHLSIAPLLFIPFVENAFKHSRVENLQEGFIKIQLEAEAKNVTFRVVNSLPSNNFTKDKVGGVGLENTKKRLALLYPNELHQLTINQTPQQFEVILNITL